MLLCRHKKIIQEIDKGKPSERLGRKAKGLRFKDYDSRLPDLNVFGSIQAT
jgi:hypothetical protein